MAIAYTDWQLEAGDLGALPWAFGRDDQVDVEFADKLGVAESIGATATADLWLLPALGEDDATPLATATTTTFAAPYLPAATVVEGTIVRQRLAGLLRGRVYRLRFWIGPAGNRRDQAVIIDVARA